MAPSLVRVLRSRADNTPRDYPCFKVYGFVLSIYLSKDDLKPVSQEADEEFHQQLGCVRGEGVVLET